jgi:hypothetical protein
MPKDFSQELTQEINSLNDLVPQIEYLADLLAKPIISDDLMQEYNGISPAQREQWLSKQQPNIDINAIIESERLMAELMPKLSVIFGSDQGIQSLMASQQQQKLQSTQKPQAKSYGIDEQD